MLLFADIETGGLDTNYSLLTASFIITNDDCNIISELNLVAKPRTGPYFIDAKSMEINGIDLVEHDKVAEPYDVCGTKLYKWLKEITNDGKDKPIPAGKGIYFDLSHIWHNLISRNTWEQFVSYRHIDIGAVVQFLKTVDKFPQKVSGSLQSIAEYYSIDTSGWHDARCDNIMTMKVLQKLQDGFRQ